MIVEPLSKPSAGLTPLLDLEFDDDLEQWEYDLRERMRLGKGPPQSISSQDATRSAYRSIAMGLEAAEIFARKANRSGSALLNDHAIARRAPIRELQKRAYAELLAEQKRLWEIEKVRRAEKDAAEAEAWRAYREQQAKRRLEEEAEAERRRIYLAELEEWGKRSKRCRTEWRTHTSLKYAAEKSLWSCMTCGGLVRIRFDDSNFIFQCSACPKTASATPDRMAQLLGLENDVGAA